MLQHNTAEDAWTVFRGKVYDCTAFFDYHPGGAKYMLMVGGCVCECVRGGR